MLENNCENLQVKLLTSDVSYFNDESIYYDLFCPNLVWQVVLLTALLIRLLDIKGYNFPFEGLIRK